LTLRTERSAGIVYAPLFIRRNGRPGPMEPERIREVVERFLREAKKARAV
jgi:hypothetical protein